MYKVSVTVPGQLNIKIGIGDTIDRAILDLPGNMVPAICEEASTLLLKEMGEEAFNGLSMLSSVILATGYFLDALEVLCKRHGWTLVITEG